MARKNMLSTSNRAFYASFEEHAARIVEAASLLSERGPAWPEV